jgi:hypothetical protein
MKRSGCSFSDPYLYAATMAEMRCKSCEALPGYGLNAPMFIFEWNDLAQMHRPKDGEAKTK